MGGWVAYPVGEREDIETGSYSQEGGEEEGGLLEGHGQAEGGAPEVQVAVKVVDVLLAVGGWVGWGGWVGVVGGWVGGLGWVGCGPSSLPSPGMQAGALTGTGRCRRTQRTCRPGPACPPARS